MVMCSLQDFMITIVTEKILIVEMRAEKFYYVTLQLRSFHRTSINPQNTEEIYFHIPVKFLVVGQGS